MNRKMSIAFLLLAPICWSLTGMFVKLIPWSSWAIAGWRSLFSAIFLWAVFKIAFPKEFRFDWSWENLAIALFYSAFSTLFAVSTKLTTSANTILLQYTAPVYVAILGPLLLGEKTSRRDWIFIGITIFGMMLFLLNDLKADEERNDLLGILAGAACGFCWGMCIMFMRKKGATQTPLSSMVIANLLTPIYCCVAMFSVDFSDLGQLSRNLGWSAVLGIGPLGLGYIFYLLAINRVTAMEAALIPAIEPLLNPIWTFLVIGEVPGFWTFVGGAIVLGVVLFRGWLAVKSPPPTPNGENLPTSA
ncbi:DMT family transporter [Deltaproteobacteria bacterium OttesenSCG-928-K17]|nr:DMT family transporter [Deltaproteobacteria bacterium OttesenSCG-928-K17]